MKFCSKCKQEKELSEFGKCSRSLSGLKSACKECCRAGQRKYYSENREKVIKRTSKWGKENRESRRKSVRKYKENYPERVKAQTRKRWLLADKEKANAKLREYRANNPEKAKFYNRTGAERSKKWRQRYPEKVNYSAMMRHATKCCATPKWLTEEHKEQIKNLYKQRRTMSEFHETEFNVDHIEPLKGKTTCGLHVPWNLRVIPGTENRKKYNKLLT